MDRYLKQKQFSKLTPEFQSLLHTSAFLIAGAGAAGTRTFEMLLRSGAGRIDICDDDTVEIQNLPRQHIYTELDAGRYKTDILCEWGRVVNSSTVMRSHHLRLNEKSARALMEETRYAAVIDCTDDYASHFELSRAGLAHNVPVFFQGAAGAEAFVFAQIPGGPCLSCIMDTQIFKEKEQHDAADGIFTPAFGISSSLSISLILAWINGTPIPSEYLQCNSYPPFTMKHIPADRNSRCSACGDKI